MPKGHYLPVMQQEQKPDGVHYAGGCQYATRMSHVEYTDVPAVFLPMATVNSVGNLTCDGSSILALDIQCHMSRCLLDASGFSITLIVELGRRCCSKCSLSKGFTLGVGRMGHYVCKFLLSFISCRYGSLASSDCACACVRACACVNRSLTAKRILTQALTLDCGNHWPGGPVNQKIHWPPKKPTGPPMTKCFRGGNL